MAGADSATTFDARGLAAAEIASRVGCASDRPATVDRAWYDTADRRLWSAGLVLEVDRRAGAQPLHVVLRDRTTNAVRWVARAETVPALAGELPAGPWRRSLETVLGIRALVPVASARLSVAAMRVSDRAGKVVAEALWERVADGPPADRAPCVVRIVPLRGYGPAAVRLAKALARAGGLAPAGTHALEILAPGATAVPSSGLDVALDPAQPAVEAQRALLRSLWQAMERIEPWLADPPDSEFLHEYRVALRRSRSVLKQADGVVDPTVRAAWRPRLRAFQQRTNRARDLDVFALELPRYRRMVPADVAGDLAPLGELVGRLRAEEQVMLRAYLGSPAHRELRESYLGLLAVPLPHEGAPLATRPVAGVAAEKIRRAHRRVVRAGRAITPGSPPTDLHELRILAKELRYALELYGSLYPPEPLGALVKELKRLQDNLGEFQDNEVHAAELRAFAGLLHGEGDAAAAVMAMGVLGACFTERQAVARERFAERFEAFASRHSRTALEKLLASPLRGGVGP